MSERSLRAHPLWTAYEHVAMVVGLGSLALMCLAWLPFAMLLYPVLSKGDGQRLGRWVIMRSFRFYLSILSTLCACRFDLDELDALRNEGPLIIAANHPSLLDAVLITSRLPNAVCVMKSSLMDKLLLGSAARLARYIRNDGVMQIIRQSRQELVQRGQLVIFPEGSRTQHFPLDPLPPTLGMIARRSGTPVQTVLLEFSSPYLGKAWPLFRKPSLPLHCRARLGRRFDVPIDHAAFTRELEQYFRREIASPEEADADV